MNRIKLIDIHIDANAKGENMEQMRKIVILAMIIAAGALAYFGIQRYQNHHTENVKIQSGTAVYDPSTGITTFLPSGSNGVTPLAHTATAVN